ncbi:MAG: FHA domain-containing protein, partial [Chloroflexi bacterium]
MIEQPTYPTLVVQSTGETYQLGHETVTVGRKSGNTIVLPPDDLKASRHHCAITWEDEHYILQDVGSANGTYLNGTRISDRQQLSNGDEIGVGNSRISVYLPLPDTRPSAERPPEAQVLMSAPAPAVGETMVQVKKPPFLANPYVGPRTFTREESSRFFGRETEARELRSLVMSERLVVFYAQSGAGKSSLINARLIPQLQEEGYSVLPVGRVSGEIPPGIDIDQVSNIYMFNLLLSMDESDGDPTSFIQMRLAHFLARLTSLDGIHYYYDPDADESPDVEDDEFQETPYVLLIDQFEEISTTHPERWQDRADFFDQLAEAMAKDPYLWVVFSLREDYVATLDPYADRLPGHMRARFYMQRMSYEAALEAVKKPAEQFGRRFAPGVAESLVDNLRQIRVQDPSGQINTRSGQFVEPVQLQVVCYQLWDNLIGRPPGDITHQNLQELGDVDQALADFYEQAIADVTKKTSVTEIELRNWFETHLITEIGTRGTVPRGRTETGGISNRAVDLLSNKFLLRSEARTGGTWYELVHDRFIEPILQSNNKWRVKQPLIQVAEDWDTQNRPANGLLEGQTLKEALASNWRVLGPLV